MNQWVKAFLTHLANKNFSAQTLRTYRTVLAEFSTFCQVRKIDLEKAFVPANLRAFIAYLQIKNPARNTVLRKIATLRSFAAYLMRQGCLDKNPFSPISSIISNILSKKPSILKTMISLSCCFSFLRVMISKNSSRVPIPPGDIMNASELS